MVKNLLTINPIKLNRPRLKDGLVARPRLIELLNQALEKKVALVSAPAGFGKTTLVCQWLQQCPAPSFWVQLEKNDSSLDRFVMLLVAALRQGFPDALVETTNLLTARLPAPFIAWKDALINDLAAMGESPFVLVLDDYHLLHNPDIDRLLSDVLRDSERAFHLVIVARRSPALSFSRLKVQGETVEIRTNDLRFTDREVADFFARFIRMPVDEATLLKVQGKVEGWAVGLSLAAINLRDDTSLDELISRMDGSDRRVSDYLLDEVLDHLPADLLDFLLKTSVLDRFCAPLCQAILGDPEEQGQSQARLETIERAQLFLTPLDNHRQWYRYHPLFQQMLQARLQVYISPGEIAALHQRAASWLAGQKMIDEGLKHLLATGDYPAAARLVERDLRYQLNLDDFQAIERRLGLFPLDFIETRPGLLLMQAWLAHFNLKLPLVSRLVDQIQAMLDDGRSAQETEQGWYEEIYRDLIQAQALALKGFVALLTNREAETVALIRQTLNDIPADWAFARGNAMLYLGLGLQAEGQGQAAALFLAQEYETCQQQRAQYGLRLLFSQASCYFLMGELESCRQAAETLLQGAQTASLALLQGWGHYLLARVYLEWNEIELAARHFSAVAQSRFTVNRICAQDGLAGWVHVNRALGQTEQARLALEIYAEFQHSHGDLPGESLLSLKAWYAFVDGDLASARRWAEAQALPAAMRSSIWMQIGDFYRARILIALCEPETLRTAGIILDDLKSQAEKTHNLPFLIRLLALQALWLEEQGRRAEALQALQQALDLGRPGGFIYPFVTLGPRLGELLRHLARQEQAGAGYLAGLLDVFTNPPPSTASPTTARLAISVILTGREQEILKLLAERLTTKEISARLVISTSTVRQHTIHIYRKLGVENRRQAAAVARDLGLIDQK